MCKYFCLQHPNRTRKFVDVLKTHKIVWNDFFLFLTIIQFDRQVQCKVETSQSANFINKLENRYKN